MEQLFNLQHGEGVSLQQQLREQIASAIMDGSIPADRPLPSSRKLAERLGVGRNTVMLTYEHLVDDGYLIARQRSGYFVNPDVLVSQVDAGQSVTDKPPHQLDWARWIKVRPSELLTNEKPPDWQSYRYCFIYGQLDPRRFPTRNWRECWRDAVSVGAINDWSVDNVDRDDEMLIEQIRRRLLSRRGVRASRDEILVTVGAQHALYLTMRLLLNARRTIGIENPGYVDARNTAVLNPARIKPLMVDQHGLVVDANMAECDCVLVTPSHQSPTTVTMPRERRKQLLQAANQYDFALIEDDYDAEISFRNRPEPALKSMDTEGRVIYIGSLSKTLAPGLRMGYLVAPADFVREARALRRLMVRHPAANNQRAVALFLARGYHDSLVGQLVSLYRERAQVLDKALTTWLPDCRRAPAVGGSSFWVEGPAWLDSRALARRAAEEHLLIESGDVFFADAIPPTRFFRLGFASIETDDIEPGVRRLSELMAELQ